MEPKTVQISEKYCTEGLLLSPPAPKPPLTHVHLSFFELAHVWPILISCHSLIEMKPWYFFLSQERWMECLGTFLKLNGKSLHPFFSYALSS